MPTTVVTGTVLALPGNVMLHTGSAALGTEQTVIIPEPEPQPTPTLIVEGGGYRPTNWPSGGKPFKF